jgi:hypothetical protein
MTRTRVLLFAAIFLLPFCASAQLTKAVVKVAPVQTLVAKRGATVSQAIEVSVDPGYHVNSDKPKDEFLIPLRLNWSGPLQVQRILFPNAEQVKVGPDTLNVFTGKFSITTDFLVPASAQPGLTTMEGKLHYQACDNQSCKRPATVNVQIPVSIQ